jgi:hypothetical protein
VDSGGASLHYSYCSVGCPQPIDSRPARMRWGQRTLHHRFDFGGNAQTRHEQQRETSRHADAYPVNPVLRVRRRILERIHTAAAGDIHLR